MLGWQSGELRLLVLGIVVIGVLSDCPVSNPGTNPNYVVCSLNGDTKAACEASMINNKACCWKRGDKNSGGNCWWDIRNAKDNRRGLAGNNFNKYLGEVLPPKPDPALVKKYAGSVKTDNPVQLGVVDEQAKRNTRRAITNPFSSIGIFPKCPVHVKLCYRVACGGYRGEQDPNSCLADRRCCFDYKLAFMKRFFGPQFMGGAPACYFGPTSKQWLYVTSFFTQWNPWMSAYILTAFKSLFKTNAFQIGGNFVCEIKFGRKAYPVGYKSELECNLVSGCWDSSLPAGSRCTMASSQIEQIFGSNQVYPSLFTNDPSETTCSANWFDIGPKAYNRLPCGIGPPPPSLFEMMFTWCPSAECCLNYASLSPTQLGEVLLLSSFGGGFSPIGGGVTSFNPQSFGYLLSAGNSASSSDLSKLFCPYRNIIKSSIFPDLSDDVEGCCDIPPCYHKKQLGGFNPPIPPTPPPTPPPVIAAWGAWGPCNAPCNQQGQRTRTCFVGNRPQPGFCPGAASQLCQGTPCPVQASWGRWQRTSGCSVTCGNGFAAYRRSCLVRNQQVNPSSCPGGSQASSRNQNCNDGPCRAAYQWSQPRVLQPCSVTCGSGYEIYGRQCVSTTTGQVGSDSMCPGSSQRQTRGCQRPPCQQQATWSQWQRGGCGATCGRFGLAEERRRCVYSNGGQANPSVCGGGEYVRIVPCPQPDCYYWSSCQSEPCQRDASGRYCTFQRMRSRRLVCYTRTASGGYSRVPDQARCGQPPFQCSPSSVPCVAQACAIEAGQQG